MPPATTAWPWPRRWRRPVPPAPRSRTTITGWESVATSYPDFADVLDRLRGDAGGPVTTFSAVAAGPIIAIDGPAGSGKSTLSRALCERLGLERLDTGAMYRAVAWSALDRGIDPADADAVGELAEAVHLSVAERVSVDGVDVTEAIRGPAVNRTVSVVAANPRVRRAMVKRQRSWVAGAGRWRGRRGSGHRLGGAPRRRREGVPDRRQRRAGPTPTRGGGGDVARRDHLDSTRAVSPLGVADGAHVIDTTGRSVEEIAEEIVGWL